MKQFSNVLDDAYSFLFSLTANVGIDRTKLKMLYAQYPWRGGYSAVNFFEQLGLLVPFSLRPAVDRMQKASPGYIDLSLHKPTSKLLVELVSGIGNRTGKEQSAYEEVRRALSEHKWLGKSSEEARLDANDIAFLKTQIAKMATALRLDSHTAQINELAQYDPLSAVKILLSVHRRLKELADYMRRLVRPNSLKLLSLLGMLTSSLSNSPATSNTTDASIQSAAWDD